VEKNADTASVVAEFNLLFNNADDGKGGEDFMSYDTPFSLYDGFPEALGDEPKGVSPPSGEEPGEGDGEDRPVVRTTEDAARRLR
jgi:hypothetical protein